MRSLFSFRTSKKGPKLKHIHRIEDICYEKEPIELLFDCDWGISNLQNLAQAAVNRGPEKNSCGFP